MATITPNSSTLPLPQDTTPTQGPDDIKRELRKKTKRVRAHCHPLADASYCVPNHPYQYDWQPQYPKLISDNKIDPNAIIKPTRATTIADIGSGFGGLLLSLSNEFKDELIVGAEIRRPACEITNAYIEVARASNVIERPDGTKHEWDASNIAVLNTNIMKYAPNYFEKGQLAKIFILFADPHFKHSKHRLRVINPSFLDVYAHSLQIGGILYTITDFKDLYLWQKKYLDEHPLFERIPDEELEGKDICFDLIHTGTHEGVKVTKNGGNKYPACYRRVLYKGTLDETKTRTNLLE